VSLAADPGRFEELTSAVFDEMSKLKADGPEDDDFTKVKEAQRRSRETNLDLNGYWLYQLLFADRYGTDPTEILELGQLIERLTREKLRDAAVQYLDNGNYLRVSLYPEKGF
jgi:predicted Zn-dependent peptidase